MLGRGVRETSLSQVKSLHASGIYCVHHLSVVVQFIMLSCN